MLKAAEQIARLTDAGADVPNELVDELCMEAVARFEPAVQHISDLDIPFLVAAAKFIADALQAQNPDWGMEDERAMCGAYRLMKKRIGVTSIRTQREGS